jgi:hypothetical protein
MPAVSHQVYPASPLAGCKAIGSWSCPFDLMAARSSDSTAKPKVEQQSFCICLNTADSWINFAADTQ